MPYFYSKDERVLVEGFKFGTVYQDQDHRDETIRVVLDRAKHTVVNVAKGKVQPMSAAQEAELAVLLNSPVVVELSTVDIPDGLMALMFGPRVGPGTPHTTEDPYRDIYKNAKPNPEDTAVKADPFVYKKGDRVKFKHNRSTGTVVQDQHPGKVVRVQWDGNDSNGREKKSLWEIPENLTALYIPRATDPVNPHQAEIDAIDAIRLPLIAELEARQAVLSKLTAAKKILQKNG